jgi:death on curing protein
LPTRVTREIARAIHAQLLMEHGGLPGPGSGDLEGTLARPQNLLVYSEHPPNLAALAASYGFSIARGHCFADGNKRLALSVSDVFLRLNGHELTAAEPDAVVIMREAAAGQLTESALAQWIEANCLPII